MVHETPLVTFDEQFMDIHDNSWTFMNSRTAIFDWVDIYPSQNGIWSSVEFLEFSSFYHRIHRIHGFLKILNVFNKFNVEVEYREFNEYHRILWINFTLVEVEFTLAIQSHLHSTVHVHGFSDCSGVICLSLVGISDSVTKSCPTLVGWFVCHLWGSLSVPCCPWQTWHILRLISCSSVQGKLSSITACSNYEVYFF